MQNLKKALVHTVYFWLKDNHNISHQTALYHGIESLTAIKEINTAYIGKPASTNRPVIDNTYSLSLTFVFDDEAAQAIYQTHPIHLKFVADCAHLWERVQVYDALHL